MSYIGREPFASGQVSTDEIEDDAVTSVKIADGTIDTNDINDNAVTSVKIADDAVTTTKIADDTISTDKLNDGAIVTAKIADSTVTNAKLENMAEATIKGRQSGAGAGDPEDLTAAQARAAIDVYSTSEVDTTKTGITLGTEQSTTSGTAFDFINIPSGTKRIGVHLQAVSLSGTDDLLIQLGTSGGIETTGYTSNSATGAGSDSTSTSGIIVRIFSGSVNIYGSIWFTLVDESNNTWSSTHVVGVSNPDTHTGAGYKSLTGELTQLRLTVTGSNTFDGGSVNITYE